jgi:LPXTG-site transpeptidase (sortase) family protein
MFMNELVRRLIVSMVLVTAASMMSHAVMAAGFPDTIGTDYQDSFAYLQERSVISGYADGYARPGAPLNRVEALKIILEAEGSFDGRIAYYKKTMPPLGLFFDTKQTDWYAPYIEAAFEKNVITGYADGSFRPGQYLRVEEAVTILMRTFGEQGAAKKAELSSYIENQPNEWYTPSINAAITRNTVMHRGRLRLGSAITRGQFIDMVYRLHTIRANDEFVYSGPEPQVAPQIVAAPRAQPQPVYTNGGSTGITVTDGVTPVVSQPQSQPQNVSIAPKIDHPFASEKYFSVSMPSLGITDLTITHPSDALSKDGVLSVLDQGVGHLFSYPGGGGKIMVYGHSSGYPWDVSEYTKIFRRVNELQAGDKIYVTYDGKLHIYQVTHEQTILAKDTAPFNDDGSGEELILYTCWPLDSVSQRYLVHAVPVETVALR